MGQLLKHLPPKTAGALVQAINRCGAQLGIGPDWVRRWIGFTVVADTLAQYQPNVFELKGGAAIELRLRRFDGAVVRPRATRDLVATLRRELDEIEGAVRAALAEPRHGSAFRVETDDQPMEKMRRLTVHVSYRVERFGRVVETAFSKVRLEVSPYEGTPRDPELVSAYSLKPFGIEGPEYLPCLPLTKQMAQKIHAVTDVPESGLNERFRDLLDIVLLSAIEAPSAELREVCEETFNIRARQPWPPEIIAHPALGRATRGSRDGNGARTDVGRRDRDARDRLCASDRGSVARIEPKTIARSLSRRPAHPRALGTHSDPHRDPASSHSLNDTVVALPLPEQSREPVLLARGTDRRHEAGQ